MWTIEDTVTLLAVLAPVLFCAGCFLGAAMQREQCSMDREAEERRAFRAGHLSAELPTERAIRDRAADELGAWWRQAAPSRAWTPQAAIDRAGVVVRGRHLSGLEALQDQP